MQYPLYFIPVIELFRQRSYFKLVSFCLPDQVIYLFSFILPVMIKCGGSNARCNLNLIRNFFKTQYIQTERRRRELF